MGNTNCAYKIVQRNEEIFYQDDEKNSCVTKATELFFEEVLIKKNKFIGRLYMRHWYKYLYKILSSLLLFLVIHTKAQTYPFSNFTIDNGLSQGQVLAVFQNKTLLIRFSVGFEGGFR